MAGPQRKSESSPKALIAFWSAVVFGTLHAIPSFYWAAGGDWLLDTVGQWAVEAREDGSLLTSLGLVAVGLVKLAAGWIPLLSFQGRIPGDRFWRLIAWVGGPGLILYGGANSVAGIGVLTGVIDSAETDRAGLIGHAFLWGPLFALWGVALTSALVLSRRWGT